MTVATLVQYVIYDRPRDFPACFVVRQWGITAAGLTPGPALCCAPDLELARKLVPAGMVNIGREPDDDEKIVEVWT